MIIYYEKKTLPYPLTHDILSKFPHAEKIAIHHYKDLFDKSIGKYPTEPCMILAKQENISILPTPNNYGYPWTSFFFKPSINCIFDCSYCYLKGSFKNRFPVIFVNYEEMQTAISSTIYEERNNWNQDQITFYASNYADLLAIEHLTSFHQHFIPFFEQFDDKVLMETRTKSANIEALKLLAISPPARGAAPTKSGRGATEIAFSLSPGKITKDYEKGTASLEEKLNAIQALLSLWYRVGLRFLPLLPVENALEVYADLISQVKERIDMEKVASIFIAPLMYNKGDFLVMQKRGELPFLELLEEDGTWMMKMDAAYYQRFEELFRNHFGGHKILWDYQ